MFAAPVKRRVEGSEMEFVRTSVVMSGRSVPRSPSEPDSSARGCDFSVSRLCCWVRRKRRRVWCSCWGKDMMALESRCRCGDGEVDIGNADGTRGEETDGQTDRLAKEI
jgi:hypothetical protein